MATSTWTPGGQANWTVETLTIHASRLALLGLTLGFGAAWLVGLTPSIETQMLVYLFGMVALNLPHGGYEHFSNLRHRGLPFGVRYVLLYLAAVFGFIALFFIRPALALAFAFGTAVAKGGHGDLHVMDGLVGSSHLEHSLQRGLAAFVRGGAVMIVPLLFWRDIYIGFSELMVSIFAPAATATVASRIETAAPVLLGLYAVALVAHLAGGYLTGGGRDWLRDVGETALLVAYFAVVPVVVSIGLYFPLWYSMRQSGRSILAHREEPSDGGLPMPAVWATFIAGAAATGLVIAFLWWIVPNPLGTGSLLGGLVAFYTIFICIVALPHVVVGEWLDQKRGIWYVP